VRIRKVFADKVKVTVDEDDKCDKERSHMPEMVSVIAFSSAFSH